MRTVSQRNLERCAAPKSPRSHQHNDHVHGGRTGALPCADHDLDDDATNATRIQRSIAYVRLRQKSSTTGRAHSLGRINRGKTKGKSRKRNKSCKRNKSNVEVAGGPSPSYLTYTRLPPLALVAHSDMHLLAPTAPNGRVAELHTSKLRLSSQTLKREPPGPLKIASHATIKEIQPSGRKRLSANALHAGLVVSIWRGTTPPFSQYAARAAASTAPGLETRPRKFHRQLQD